MWRKWKAQNIMASPPYPLFAPVPFNIFVPCTASKETHKSTVPHLWEYFYINKNFGIKFLVYQAYRSKTSRINHHFFNAFLTISDHTTNSYVCSVHFKWQREKNRLCFHKVHRFATCDTHWSKGQDSFWYPGTVLSTQPCLVTIQPLQVPWVWKAGKTSDKHPHF